MKSGPFDTWGPYVLENRSRTLGGSHTQRDKTKVSFSEYFNN